MRKTSTILVVGLLSLVCSVVTAEKEEASRVDFPILKSIGADGLFEYLEPNVSVVLPDARQLRFRQLGAIQVEQFIVKGGKVHAPSSMIVT